MDNKDRITANSTVTNYYAKHPINAEQILEKLKDEGADLDVLSQNTLQNFDQDHYGGTSANDVLAKLAGITDNSFVLDACCGLGGPARYLAHNYRCRVQGLDLTESRIEGARLLTNLVGLSDLVTFTHGNALEMPFDDQIFDVVIGQEAFCHIPNKKQLVGECARVLKPGGQLVFTDIVATDKTTNTIRQHLKSGMAFCELARECEYRRFMEDFGFVETEVDDLSDDWCKLLIDRLAMYRSLKEQTVSSFGASHFEEWDRSYAYFVGLYETRALGGARFHARRRDS